MRKIYSCAVVLVALALLIAGCGSKEKKADMPYEIVEENGEYYIILDEEYREKQREREWSESDLMCMRARSVIRFTSIEDMKRSIETGDLTEDELIAMAEFKTDDLGRIPIMDLSALTQASFPSCFDDVMVVWRDAEYWYTLRSFSEEIYGSLSECLSKDEWQEEVDSWCGFKDNEDIEVTGRTLDSERNAEIVSYRTKYGQYQEAYYTIKNRGDEIHVFESYVLSEELELTSIELYGHTNDHYFHAVIRDFTERPSLEWLSQFEMTDYEEEPSWLIPVCVCGAVAVAGVGVGIFFLWHKKRKSGASAAPVSAEEEEQ